MKRSLVVLTLMAATSLSSQNLLSNLNPSLQMQQATNPIIASNQNMRNVQQYTNPPAERNDTNNDDNNPGNVFEQQAIQSQMLNNDVSENTKGERWGNESLSVNIPALQIGSGSLLNTIDLDLKLPKINFKPIKLGGNTSASVSSHSKNHTLANKWHKLNRNINGKLSAGKKLHFKVDKCFEW